MSWDKEADDFDQLPQGSVVVRDPHDGVRRVQEVSHFLLKIVSCAAHIFCRDANRIHIAGPNGESVPRCNTPRLERDLFGRAEDLSRDHILF